MCITSKRKNPFNNSRVLARNHGSHEEIELISGAQREELPFKNSSKIALRDEDERSCQANESHESLLTRETLEERLMKILAEDGRKCRSQE